MDRIFADETGLLRVENDFPVTRGQRTFSRPNFYKRQLVLIDFTHLLRESLISRWTVSDIEIGFFSFAKVRFLWSIWRGGCKCIVIGRNVPHRSIL